MCQWPHLGVASSVGMRVGEDDSGSIGLPVYHSHNSTAAAERGPAMPYLGVAVLEVVGRAVGIRVGVAVGDRVGVLEGAAPVGVMDGMVVRGKVVGESVICVNIMGWIDGSGDRRGVGGGVAADVGVLDGVSDGVPDGATLGRALQGVGLQTAIILKVIVISTTHGTPFKEFPMRTLLVAALSASQSRVGLWRAMTSGCKPETTPGSLVRCGLPTLAFLQALIRRCTTTWPPSPVPGQSCPVQFRKWRIQSHRCTAAHAVLLR